MSNYVVTDTQLEDIADAIRAKSGGSSPLAFPAGFVSEIGSIQTGGGLTYVDQYADVTPGFYFDRQMQYNCPDPLVFNYPNATYIAIFPNTFRCPASHVELYIKDAIIDTGNLIGGGGYMTTGVTHLKIRCGNSNVLRKNNTQVSYLLNCNTLKYCDFILDLSNYNRNIATGWFGAALEEIRFTENSIRALNHNIGVVSDSPFSDASIISLANALQTGSGTITFGVKIKARINSDEIIGSVSDGTFIADENGTVTIANFITNTKGWTIA